MVNLEKPNNDRMVSNGFEPVEWPAVGVQEEGSTSDT